MTIKRFVDDVRASGVELWLEDGNLKLRGPKTALTADVLERLKANKPLIIDYLRDATDAGEPLSSTQESLWTLYRLSPDSVDYNVAYALTLDHALDGDALGRAWTRLVERHPILRKRFVDGPDGPSMQTVPGHVPAVERIDVAAADLDAAVDTAIDTPYRLEAGPPVRVRVLRVDGTDRVFVLALHHIAADFGSVEILLNELAALYAAARDAGAAHLAPQEKRHADYVADERAYLASARADADWDYWRGQLDGELPLLALRPRRARVVVTEPRGRTLRVRWDAARTERIRAAAAHHGVSVYNFMLALYYVLLAKYSGTRDLIVGVPTSDRSATGAANLVGHFVNTLPIRVDFDGTLRFDAWLARVQQAVLDGLDRRAFPFTEIVRRLAPERMADHSPVFQVMFNWNYRAGGAGNAAETAGLRTFGALRYRTGNGVRGSTCDVGLSISDDDDDGALMRCSWSFVEALYPLPFVQDMADAYATLIDQAIDDPQRLIHAFSLIAPGTDPSVYRSVPRAEFPPPCYPSVQRMFVEQAARTPDAIALVDRGRRFTYAELDAQSARIARHLVARGIGAEHCVPLLTARRAEMIAAIFGILRTGAAYVPLDPKYPHERLEYILGSAGSTLVVGRRSDAPDIAIGDRPFCDLDTLLATEPPDVAIDPEVAPDQLAYVLYTSGSTGEPKGVALTHGNASTLIEWAYGEFPRDDFAGVLGATSISFDLSVFEIFGALCGAGGKLILCENLLELPDERDEVTLVVTVPSLADALLRDGHLPPNTRSITLAGEALTRDVANALHADSATLRVYMLSGPTEDTTYDTCQLVDRDSDEKPHLGTPFRYRYLYILDAGLNPVPDGVCGELYLGGVGLARGYYGRPDLTAERFVPDPYSSVPGQRLYRSGDLGARRTSGDIDHLGRVDRQAKVRGFRVELEEVENRLAAVPGVAESLVEVRRYGGAGAQLIAYVALAPGMPRSAEAIDAALARHLPHYMIPSRYVWLDGLPRLANGKPDRKSLPAPDLAGADDAAADAAAARPRSRIDELVAGIWAEVLGAAAIHAHSHFFRLGGHSLLAAQTVARINRALGTALPPNAALETPRYDDFLARVNAALASDARDSLPLVHVEPAPETASYAQRRMWLLDRLADGDRHTYNIPLALALDGPLDVARFERALNAQLERHASLRTAFAQSGAQFTARTHAAAPLALVVEDARGDWRDTAIAFAREPFDLTQAPLIAARLLRTAPERHVLLLTIHHIAFDGRSTAILLADLAAHYRDDGAGALAPLDVDYADYAAWQRRWLDAGRMDEQLHHWKTALDGAPTLLELPADHARPRESSPCGAIVETALPDALADDLRRIARQHDASLYMLLFAAFQLLLSRYARQPDLVIGTPFDNRRHALLENVVGMFVNTLPVRGRVVPSARFVEHLAQTRRDLLDAFAHADAPFDQIVEAVQPERRANVSPLVQATFSLEYVDAYAFDAGGLSWQLVDHPQQSAKFDLSLQMRAYGDALSAHFTYNDELFSPARIAALAGHWHELLRQIAADPRARLRDLHLPDAAEQHALVATFNATDAPYDAARPVHALIRANAAERPDAVALVDAHGTLTYAELVARAARMAVTLRRLGAGPETPVGVSMPMRRDAIVAMLAALMAGAAYVPIDSATPAERIAHVCDDAVLTLAIVDATTRDRFPAGVTCIDVDTPTDESNEAIGDVAVSPHGLAYVIFTSGSSGRPKGVAVDHAALLNLVHWHNARYGVTADTRCSQVAGFGFDAAVWEIWPALAAGARLCLADADTRLDPRRLAAWLDAHAIDVAFLPTPLAESVLRDANAVPRTLRHLLTGGDRLTVAPRAGDTYTLVNHYGPTENAVVATAYDVAVGETLAPIGTPIANNRAYVLDDGLNPQPAGVVGELYLGGASLARGYVGRPDWTAERFVPDPFAATPGARLYRTGDLVAHRDGALAFHGRADGQVKLRGYRIELDEIRLALEAQDEVASAVVRLHTPDGAPAVIAAYIVPHEGTATDRLGRRLRDRLVQQLPDYMLPGACAILERMPLTPNGKIDYRALPEPALLDTGRGTIVAARTPQEELLVSLWEAHIGYAPIGVTDNFFDVGGHSLLAMQLATKIQETTGRECTVRMFLDNPTVEKLAAVLAQADESVAEPLPEIEPRPQDRYEPFPLTDIQQTYLVGRQGVYELGDIATQAYSEVDLVEIDAERVGRTWRKLIARHDMLRMVLTDDYRQRILPDVPHYSVGYADLAGLASDAETARLDAIRREMTGTVRSGREWPLFENRVTRRADGTYRLHTTIDALLADGWSTQVLMSEFLDAYFDQEDRLPALGVSYRDYVLAERKLRDGALYERAQQYWTARAATLPGPPELPLRPRAEGTASGRFRRRAARLAKPEWQAFQRAAKALGVTPTNLLLAAYTRTLGRFSANPRFTLNLTLFNRLPLHPQINAVVGDFTSLNLLEVDTGVDEFDTFAQRLQQQLWSDLDHKYFSGVEVLRELARVRGGDRAVMPVVFTSALAGSGASAERQAEIDARLQTLGEEYGSSQTSQVWIDHAVVEQNGDLVLTWESIDDLFEPGVLDAMFGAYLDTLQQLCAQRFESQDRRAAALPTAQAERRTAANATDAPLSDRRLHELVREQAQRTPDRVAVIAPDVEIRYAQLWNAASALAARLRALGAQPNQLVAVVMHKGWEQVLACLAIQQAGAAYMPVDANLPPARRADLMRQGEVRIVLAQPGIEPDAAYEWIALDGTALDAAGVALDDVQTLDDLAYVIFTSGSTGTPKGVMIDHRGAVNTVLDVNRRFGVGADDRVLALSSLSFDLSVYDIFGLLAVGGAIVVPHADETRDPDAWARTIAAHGVTVFNAVPALMQLLVDQLPAQPLPASLRVVMMSGDWIPVDLPRRIRAASPRADIALIGMGGATEASIWSNYFRIESVDPSWASIPYGRPLTNQRFHVLDADLRHCPDWVPGELYIGGVGLARGYWRDADKTRTSFITHPASGERLYRTGDLGRYRDDGEIEFLGRRDTQVKIQGYRVELGEIESLLERHDEVARCAANVHVERAGAAAGLVAYVVPAAADAVPDGCIADPAERLAFTLSQPAIRHDLVTAPRVLLRRPDAVYATTAAPPRAARVRHGGAHEALGCWLGCLARWPVDGAALGKHYYPSAGSLYPVQVYVSVGAPLPGVPSGVYYYHPLDHALCRVADADPAGGTTVALVGRLDAIAPLYGRDAEPFCALEAGYVRQLLAGNGHAHGWREAGTADVRLALDASQRLLSTSRWEYVDDDSADAEGSDSEDAYAELSLTARQSYREFHGDAASLARVPHWLAAAQAAVHDAAGDTFIYVHRKTADGGTLHALSPDGTYVSLGAAPAAPVYAGLNRDIDAAADFTVFVVSASADAAALHGAGRVAQQLMAAAPRHGLGLCPVGSVDADATLAGVLGAGERVVHALLGGAIAPEQTTRWAPYSGAVAAEPLAQRLRHYLAERLPAYMVPAQIIEIAAIPLTSNGKVDRKALPAPAPTAQRSRNFQAPQTELEIRLAALWRELLGIDAVGVNDNFFEIGGNSMLLIQAHRRLQDALGRDIAIVDLFRHSDIASLTRHLATRDAAPAADASLADAQAQAQRQRAALKRRRDTSRQSVE